MPQETSGAVFAFGLHFSVRSVCCFVPHDDLGSHSLVIGRRNLTESLKQSYRNGGSDELLLKNFKFQVKKHLFGDKANDMGVFEALDVGTINVEDDADGGRVNVGRVREELEDLQFRSPYENFQHIEQYKNQPVGLLCRIVDAEVKCAKESGMWYLCLNVVGLLRSSQVLIFDLPKKADSDTRVYDDMIKFLKTQEYVYIGGLSFSFGERDQKYYLGGSADQDKPVLQQAYVLFGFASELIAKFGDLSALGRDFESEPHFQQMRGQTVAIRVDAPVIPDLEDQCSQRKCRVVSRMENVQIRGNIPKRFQMMLCECRQIMRADVARCPRCKKTEEHSKRVPFESISVTLKQNFVEREANIKGVAYQKFIKKLAPEFEEVISGERLLRSSRMKDDLWTSVVRGLKRYKTVTADVSVAWYKPTSGNSGDERVSRWLDIVDIF